ncbi:MAG: hypothetical protein ACRDL5_01735 [Solirubrobacteraceae bacterium]
MTSTASPDPDDERAAADSHPGYDVAPNPFSDRAYRLIMLGYISAVAMPPVGLVVAIVVALRETRVGARHWRWIVLVSIVAAVLWALIISTGALTSTSGEFD